ncbi:PQQ-binding-like beta-propeller repeat protein [Uniformispora flossi]|uniref:outer membrane protein assembly factor BamB family protein n=1 Tax=Uniformispora flossi TaxID=3390723 RepID=UPI003D03E969
MVTLAVVAGLGAWFAFSGSDTKHPKASPTGSAARPTSGVAPGVSSPATISLAQAWTVGGAGTGAASDAVRGGWAGNSKVFVVRASGVTMYDPATGAVNGEVALPSTLKTICNSMAKPAGGIGLVGWAGASGDCDSVSAVDLAEGTVLWTQQLEGVGAPWEMALSANETEAVIGAGSFVFAYDLRTGSPLWTWQSPPTGALDDHWDVHDVLASPQSVALTLQRADDAANYVGAVASLDPTTGALRRQAALADGPDSWPNLLSASPIIVFDQFRPAGSGGDRKGRIIVFDDALAPRTQLPGGDDGITVEQSNLLDGLNRYCGAVVVHGNVLYAAIGSADDVRSVGAYDLTTGRRMWTKSTGVVGYPLPLSADDEGVLVLVGEDHGTDAEVLRMSAADGNLSTIHTLHGEDVTVDPAGLAYVLGDRVLLFNGSRSTPTIQAFAVS